MPCGCKKNKKPTVVNKPKVTTTVTSTTTKK